MSDNLRVLITQRNSDDHIWIAECLETGFITSGDDYNEAREGILKVLRIETLHARDNGIALKRFPVRPELQELWESVISEHQPDIVELFPSQRKPPGRITAVSVAKAG